MSTPLERFKREYCAAFEAYVGGGRETGLDAAYELGRMAMLEDITILDLAEAHHGTVAKALARSSAGSSPLSVADLIAASSAFFLESLSTFEMTRRGFKEAHETARLEQRYSAQLSKLAAASLEITSQGAAASVVGVVTDQAREIIGAQWACTTVELEDGREERTSSGTAAGGPGEVPARITVPFWRSDGSALGAIEASGKLEEEFDKKDEAILSQLGQIASVAIENLELLERERSIAATLQRSLLPGNLPRVAGLSVAWRYLPGGGGSRVGGDWYDVIQLGEEGVALVVGDVTGRGIHAASIMGQLRIAVRAYALEGHGPAATLYRLDRLLQQLDQNHLATAVFMTLDIPSGSLRLALAGHPPPLLVVKQDAQFLTGALSPPLGAFRGTTFREAKFAIGPGSTVVAYTDGLIEQRDSDIDDRLEQLRRVVSGRSDTLEALCDRVLGEMLAGTEEDDVALLVARYDPTAC